MKALITAFAFMLFSVAAMAQDQKTMENAQVVDDYAVVSDQIVDGVRCIVATPSAKVCSKQIDIEIKDGIIQKVVYTRGCEGNAKGIGALIKDMSVEEAIRRLEGINCGKRGTSCPDQLAKILKALK
jgi:uncharacterized protein (TIGR03905 family)